MSGCGSPGKVFDAGFPCSTGSITYRVLQSGLDGLRFDVLTDFRNPPPIFAGIPTTAIGQTVS